MRRAAGPVLVLLALAGSIAISPFGEPPHRTLPPVSIDGYSVVYRVEERTTRTPRISTEVLEVRRPYGARVELRPGKPPGGRITTGNVSSREFFWQLDDGGALQFGVRRVPMGPLRDASYTALRDAAAHRVIDAVGTSEVLGRRCVWFAFSQPAPQPLAPPTEGSRVESCVTPSGIVLLETWHLGGRTARIVQAVRLRTAAPAKTRFLEGRRPESEPLSQPETLSLLRGAFVVSEDAQVDAPIEVRAPRGWRSDRHAVAAQSLGGTSRATQIVIDSYLRGPELVVVERGAHPSMQPSWPVEEGAHIDLGSLGEGRLVSYVDRVELRAVGNLGFVRVTAPSRRVALDFVRGLRHE
jgi:hypothetical protein